ncbi:hypothetical protein DSECCO2_563360 [anaerobic digester metagenome]
MDFHQLRADLREDLVMGHSQDVPIAQAVIVQPAPADRDVAHLPVEHGQRGGGVPDENLQPLLALAQGGQGFLGLGAGAPGFFHLAQGGDPGLPLLFHGLGLGRGQGALGRLAFGQIQGIGDPVHGPAGFIPEDRDVQEHGEAPPVPGHVFALEDGVVRGVQGLDHLPGLAAPVLGEERGDRQAEHFVRLVAAQPGEGRVDGQHRVCPGVDDGQPQFGVLEGLGPEPQLGLGAAQGRQVDKGSEHALLQKNSGDPDGALHPVLAGYAVLASVDFPAGATPPFQGILPARHGFGARVGFGKGQTPPRGDVGHVVQGVPEQLLETPVAGGDAPCPVDHGHGHGRLEEHVPETRLAVLEGPALPDAFVQCRALLAHRGEDDAQDDGQGQQGAGQTDDIRAAGPGGQAFDPFLQQRVDFGRPHFEAGVGDAQGHGQPRVLSRASPPILQKLAETPDAAGKLFGFRGVCRVQPRHRRFEGPHGLTQQGHSGIMTEGGLRVCAEAGLHEPFGQVDPGLA